MAEPIFYNSNPEGDEIVLRVKDVEPGAQITNWISYQFDENFLEPFDCWSFVVADERLNDATKRALVTGAAVTLSLNGNVQSTGFIDKVQRRASRSGGVEWHLSGRNKLGQAVDGGFDPSFSFLPTQTAEDVVLTLLAPFGGWTDANSIAIDNNDNRGVITGQKRGVHTSKKGKPLKQFQIHQLKCYPQEGCYAFCARILQRLGLWVWQSADGTKLIVGTPDFTQSPIYRLMRQYGGVNNILDGEVTYDITNQPNVILAEGFGGGGEFGHSQFRSMMFNPTTTFSAFAAPGGLASVQQFLTKYNSAKLLTPKSRTPGSNEYIQLPTPSFRVMYLHDDESKTQEQLDNFVYREMALRLRQSLHVRYTVEGHGQYAADGSFTPWAIDTVVDVQDEVGGVLEPLWVMSRKFNKSRSGGTTTELELIRLYSLDL